VLSPYRASGTAATAVLSARAARALWAHADSARDSADVDLRQLAVSSRPLLAGLETRFVVEKERGGAPGSARRLTLRVPSLLLMIRGTTSASPAPPVLIRGTASASPAPPVLIRGTTSASPAPPVLIRGTASASPTPPVPPSMRRVGHG